jgi:hypothetical protein
VFTWVASQSGLTGAVLLALGLAAAFYGVRLLRLLLPLISAELGYALAILLANWTGWAAFVIVPVAIVLSGTAALARPRVAAVVASGATWGLLGAFLTAHLGFDGLAIWLCALVFGAAGAILAVVSPATMTVLLTSLHGAAWIILGFVGLAASILPVVCSTFQSWVGDEPLVIPVLLAMLVTTAYSCQINNLRGDLRVGAVAQSGGSTGLR